MILILQLLKDPLDGFVNGQIQIIEKNFGNIITLDNYSEDWLVQKTIEEFKHQSPINIIIKRDEVAEFKSLLPLIHHIPQLEVTKILFFGKEHPLINRMGNFKNIEVLHSLEKEISISEVKSFFKL